METAGFEVEIIDVVECCVSADKIVFVLQKRLYSIVDLRKDGIIFEFAVVVGKHKTVLAPAVRQMKFTLGID